MKKELPHVGSRDFYQDACEALHASDTPHFLLCGYNGSNWQYFSHNITTAEGCDWFRDSMLTQIENLKSQLLESEEYDAE